MVEGGVALPFPATGQVAIIRPYAKKPVLRGEERISFNLFNEATQTYQSKLYAFTTSAIAFDLHSWRGWKVQFDTQPQYPRILAIIGEVPLPNTPSARRSRAQPQVP
jgi:hypothetical protein